MSSASSVSTRGITAEDRAIIKNFYNSQCSLTKLSVPSPEYAYIIPRWDSELNEQVQIKKEMEVLGLIPTGMSWTSFRNTIPLEPNSHRTYDSQFWSFLPTERVLLFYIAFEERDLVRRAVATVDPGRLSYDQTYKHFPKCAEFDSFFSRVIPAFATYDDGIPILRTPPILVPVRELIASVNIIVRQAPVLLPDPRTRRSMFLAIYLRSLWFAIPQDFRALERPASIEFTVDGAEVYLETTNPGLWNQLKDAIEGINPVQTENKNNNAKQELGSDTAELDRGVPDEEFEVPDSASADGNTSLEDEGFAVKEDNMGGGRLTSNDWAFLKTRTILGGKVLDL